LALPIRNTERACRKRFRHVFRGRDRSGGNAGITAPKEQPPRKLSGKWTATRHGTLESAFPCSRGAATEGESRVYQRREALPASSQVP